jgi:hypothetical protein
LYFYEVTATLLLYCGYEIYAVGEDIENTGIEDNIR